MPLLGLIGVGVVVFGATNIDDLFFLTLFFADHRFRPRHVVAGQYLGISALVAVSAAGSLVSFVLPATWISLLGSVPLALGVKRLLDLRRSDVERPPSPARSNVLAVAGVTVASGSDNIGVYTPLFAARQGWEVAVLVGVFAVMVSVWCLAARCLVRHRRTAKGLRRYGHILLPVVLIALGLWIIADAWPLFRLGARPPA